LGTSGDKIISGSEDDTVKVWETASGALLQTLEGHQRAIKAVALTKNEQRVVSGSDDGALKIWDITTRAAGPGPQGRRAPVKRVALNADGKTAISASSDGTLTVWGVPAREELRTFGYRRDSGGVTALVLSADGQLAVSLHGGDHSVRVWDVAAGKELRSFEGRPGSVEPCALGPDGKL